MPRKKRDPVQEAIYAEVMRFLYLSPQERETPEERAHWAELWRDHFAGEKMARMEAGTADMMTYFGTHQAMQDGDYVTALDYLNTFFAHPNAATVDVVTLSTLRCNQMFCLLYLHQEARALEVGRALLAIERRSHLRTALELLHAPLYIYLLQQEANQTATVELTEFVWDVAQLLHHHARRRLPSPATFAQLCEAFNQTWHKSDREQLREHCSDYAEERNALLKERAETS